MLGIWYACDTSYITYSIYFRLSRRLMCVLRCPQVLLEDYQRNVNMSCLYQLWQKKREFVFIEKKYSIAPISPSIDYPVNCIISRATF